MSTQNVAVNNWPGWRGRLSVFRLAVWVLWHLLALSAPFFYGRLELVLFLIVTYVTLQFGLVLGYHRLLSHHCFATPRFVLRGLALLGSLAMQNGPISWAATHRMHHRVAEQEFDPHSPRHGLSWSHFVWTLFEHPRLSRGGECAALARELHRDRFIRFCEEHFILLNSVATAAVIIAGFAVGGLPRAFSFFVWIICLRVVVLWHTTFLTNSMGHTLGYRNFDTPDGSRNVWLLGVLALGDGWHNNHHAFPSCAAHGRRWFELDVTYRIIGVLERVGLAWDVRHPTPVSKPEAAGAGLARGRGGAGAEEAHDEFQRNTFRA